MTIKNQIIKFICETIALVIGWFFWYIVLVILSWFFNTNPMNETLMVMALGLLCLNKIDSLGKKVDGE